MTGLKRPRSETRGTEAERLKAHVCRPTIFAFTNLHRRIGNLATLAMILRMFLVMLLLGYVTCLLCMETLIEC